MKRGIGIGNGMGMGDICTCPYSSLYPIKKSNICKNENKFE